MNSGYHNETCVRSDWEPWLVQHAPRLLLFARQQTRCEADAQDVVQEAVVECWHRRMDNVPPAAGLLFATIRRRAIDLGRSTDRRAGRESVVAGAIPEVWFDEGVEERERSQLIQTAMNQLPENYREVVTLKVWGELTFIEIAEVLAIPANTAASRYRYGLVELRKLTTGIFP
ncbi:MAG: sigma-70 family RNA polymerase sigma factor [Limisphaerales bacterium]